MAIPMKDLENEIEELKAQLALSRSASRNNWLSFIGAQKALYGAMLWLDVSLSDEQFHAINKAEWYIAAQKILGWDLDHDMDRG